MVSIGGGVVIWGTLFNGHKRRYITKGRTIKVLNKTKEQKVTASVKEIKVVSVLPYDMLLAKLGDRLLDVAAKVQPVFFLAVSYLGYFKVVSFEVCRTDRVFINQKVVARIRHIRGGNKVFVNFSLVDTTG